MGMPTYQYQSRKEKLEALKVVADNAIVNISRNKDVWREFLRFYAGFYKYSFSEALLIYEYAPNATACGELKHWNMVGRRVHKGTKGIPIINMSDRDIEIRHVFDVADTYGAEQNIPRRWTLPDQYKDAVLIGLQKHFTVDTPTVRSHIQCRMHSQWQWRGLPSIVTLIAIDENKTAH